jgi:IS5 family transposase
MDQITFSEAEYQNKKRKTRRELFLERMDKLIPWTQWRRR